VATVVFGSWLAFGAALIVAWLARNLPPANRRPYYVDAPDIKIRLNELQKLESS